jgi:hypothetical protein
MITTGFWNQGEALVAAEPWEEVLNHGGSLIREELMEDPDQAIRKWNRDLTSELVTLVLKLFERKMTQPEAPIELAPAESRLLRSSFQDPKAKYAKMAELCYQKHQEIGAKPPPP